MKNLNYNYVENSVTISREETIDQRQQELLKEVQNLELELELQMCDDISSEEDNTAL